MNKLRIVAFLGISLMFTIFIYGMTAERSKLLGQIDELGLETDSQQSFFDSLFGGGRKVKTPSYYDTGGDHTVDFLVLGNRGVHSDAIMVASVNEPKSKITLFSIPRDLYVNTRRINEYYSSYGPEYVMDIVGTVTGLNIDQYIQVDLNAFVDLVDIVGGLDIYVDDAIYDSLYPAEVGDGYNTYSIDVGHHHMTGEEALKYTRSRNSTSDFDRAERQQGVMASLKNKIQQLDLIWNVGDILSLVQIGIENTQTDVAMLDMIDFYYEYQDFDVNTGFVLSTGNYLYSIINENEAYTLLPRAGNFNEIHEAIAELVN